MKRFLAAMTLGMVLVMGTVSVQAADLSVTVNGTAITFDAQPFIQGGVTLVPMRAIMDSLGATVQWDAQAKTITAVKDGKTIVLTIDNKVATVNGQAVQLEATAQIVGNRTFVPVRFISEQFGLNVDWDAANQVISLRSTEVKSETPAPAQTTGLVNGMRPEFKAAMDSYEAFYDEYCDFMKNYNENSPTADFLAKYSELMAKAAEMNEKFEAWDDDEEMNNVELKYYLDVHNRILQKLIDLTE